MALTGTASGMRSFSFMGRCKMIELLATIRSLTNGGLERRRFDDARASAAASTAVGASSCMAAPTAASLSSSVAAAPILLGPGERMNQGEAQYAKLLVYGTPGWGKSYMMAAAAAVLQRDFLEGRSYLRVVYLPDCGQLREEPVAYMQKALLFAFANDEERLPQIAACRTADDLVDFVRSVPLSNSFLLFLADQTNKLTGKLGVQINAEKEKKKAFALDLLVRASFGSNFLVEAISINDSNKEDVGQKQENRKEMPVFGEMSQVRRLPLARADQHIRRRWLTNCCCLLCTVFVCLTVGGVGCVASSKSPTVAAGGRWIHGRRASV
jgi:hypothetical protein